MRIVGIDIFRGYAILLMVIFHFNFDLNNFHYVDYDLKHGLFWHYYRYVIVSMFIFISGVSFQITYKNGINLKKLRKRVLLLGGASLLVSIGSYTQFPDTWIYFGILHFFLFATFAGLLFIKTPKIALALAVAILIAYNFHLANMHWFFILVQPYLHLPIYYTEDLVIIIPWFGVYLLGMVFASYGWHKTLFERNFFNKESKINTFFAFLGRHSLLIYLLHQPIFFGIFMLL